MDEKLIFKVNKSSETIDSADVAGTIDVEGMRDWLELTGVFDEIDDHITSVMIPASATQEEIETYVAITLNAQLDSLFYVSKDDWEDLEKPGNTANSYPVYALHPLTGEWHEIIIPVSYELSSDAGSGKIEASEWLSFVSNFYAEIKNEITDYINDGFEVIDEVKYLLDDFKGDIIDSSVSSETALLWYEMQGFIHEIKELNIEIDETNVQRQQGEELKKKIEDRILELEATDPSNKEIPILKSMLIQVNNGLFALYKDRTDFAMKVAEDLYKNVDAMSELKTNQLEHTNKTLNRWIARLKDLLDTSTLEDTQRTALQERYDQLVLKQELVTKKVTRLELRNEITRLERLREKGQKEEQDPETGQMIAIRRLIRQYEKQIIDLETDIANALGVVIESPSDKRKREREERKAEKEEKKESAEIVGNTEPMTTPGTNELTALGQQELMWAMSQSCSSEEDVNRVFSKLITGPAQLNLCTSFIYGLARINPEIFFTEIQGLPKHHRAYLHKYRNIVHNNEKKLSSRLGSQIRAEDKFIDRSSGTVKDWKILAKQVKRKALKEKKRYGNVAKYVGRHAYKEYYEGRREWLEGYGTTLASYDAGVPPTNFPGACPPISTLWTNKDTDFRRMCVDLGFDDPDLIMDSLDMVGYEFAPELGIPGYPISIPEHLTDKYDQTIPRGMLVGEGRIIRDVAGADDNYITEGFVRTIKAREKSNADYYRSGSLSFFREIALRSLEGREGYNFQDTMKEMHNKRPDIVPGYSDTQLDTFLEGCIFSLVDDSVADYIKEKYYHYHGLLDGQTRNQLISLYFLDALHDIYGIPEASREVVKGHLMEVFDGGWNLDGAKTLGNEALGEKLFNFVAGGSPDVNNKAAEKGLTVVKMTGLNRGKDWLDEGVGIRGHIVTPDGKFRGVLGINSMVAASLTSTLGLDPKFAPQIAAYTKAGLFVVGASYGWTLLQEIFSGSFGDKVRKIGITALVAGVGPMVLQNRNLDEFIQYWLDNEKGEDFVKGGGSEIMKKLGFKKDPFEENEEVRQPTTEVADIFGDMKMKDIPKYIKLKGKDLTGDHMFYMDKTDVAAFVDSPYNASYTKTTLQSLLAIHSNNADTMSIVINSGLVQSGLYHTKFDELTKDHPDNPFRDMKFADFQAFWQDAEAVIGRIGTLLNGPYRNDLMYKYIERTPKEREAFNARLLEMQSFDAKYQKERPFFQYHFLPFREDLFDEASIDTKDRDILLKGFDNDDGYKQIAFEYLIGDPDYYDPTDTDRTDNRNDRFLDLFAGDAEAEAFVSTYVLPANSIDNLKGINSSDASAGYPEMNEVYIEAQESWVVGDSESLTPETKEVWLHNFENLPDQEAFVNVDYDPTANSGSAAFWLPAQEGKYREEYKLEKFAALGGNVKAMTFVKDQNILFFKMVIDGEERVLGLNNGTKYLSDIIQGLNNNDMTINFDRDDLVKPAEMESLRDKGGAVVNQITAFLGGALSSLGGPGEWLVDTATTIGDTVGDVVEGIDDALPQPRIKFAKTARRRPRG